MLALSREPNERNLAMLLYGEGRPRRDPRETAAAVVGALVIFGGLSALLMAQKFTPIPMSPVTYDPMEVFMDRVRPPPPPEPEPEVQRNPPPPPLAINVPTDVVQTDLPPLVAVPDDPPARSETITGAFRINETAEATSTESVVRDPPRPSLPRVIQNPSWQRRPTSEQMAKLYPERAAERGISGGATLLCEVAANGRMRNCSIDRESPPGRGFGKAAMDSAQYFQMNPKTVNGQTVEGAKVRIPVQFNLE